MLETEFPGGDHGFGFAEDTDDLYVGKSLIHGTVPMKLMKTLLTSRCIYQWGAGQYLYVTLTKFATDHCKEDFINS